MYPVSSGQMDQLAQQEFTRLLELFPNATEITLKPGGSLDSNIIDCSLKIINGCITQGVPGLTKTYTWKQEQQSCDDNQLEKLYRTLLSRLDSPPPAPSNSSVSSKPDRSYKEIAADHLEQGNIEDALASIRKISSEYKRDPLYVKVSEHYLKEGDVEKAVDVIRKISSEYKKDPQYVKVSEHYLKEGDVEKAVGVIGKINIKETQDNLYERIFKLYLESDRTNEAVAYVEKIVKLNSYAERIKIMEDSGLHTLAEALKGKLKIEAYACDKMYEDIIDSYMKQGQKEKALEIIERIKEDSKKDSVRKKYGL